MRLYGAKINVAWIGIECNYRPSPRSESLKVQSHFQLYYRLSNVLFYRIYMM